MKKITQGLIGLMIVFLLAGCSSLPQGSQVPMMNVELDSGGRQESAAVVAVRMKPLHFPQAVLTGQAVQNKSAASEEWEINAMQLEWFSNWNGGWSEAVFNLDGKLKLVTHGSLWELLCANVPEVPVLESAKIRYGDNYLVGDKALVQFQHRWDRLLATAVFLKGKLQGGLWNLDAARKILFPEVYGWTGELQKKYADSRVVRAESVDWNTAYTAQDFPLELRELRDSGTLLRDFEEGAELAALAYEWPRLWEQKVLATVLKKGR